MLIQRRRRETTPESKDAYEQSYGDAQAGGWAPRRRSEDLSERSHYSSQRDHQEDRAGFQRGWQGGGESTEQHRWGKRHARGDERSESPDDETEATEEAGSDTAAWLERRKTAARKRVRRSAKRKVAARKKAKRAVVAGKKPRRKVAARKKPAAGRNKGARRR